MLSYQPGVVNIDLKSHVLKVMNFPTVRADKRKNLQRLLFKEIRSKSDISSAHTHIHTRTHLHIKEHVLMYLLLY